MMALVIVANEYDLNPFTKEIYAFPAKGGGIVPVISIDGWLHRMNAHPQFDGIEYETEFADGQGGKPYSVTARVHRKDRKFPTVVTEYYSECYRSTDPWNQCPARMLRHRATIQAARIAFGFAGQDENDAEIIKQATGRVVEGGAKLYAEPIAPALDAPAEEEPTPEVTPREATALERVEEQMAMTGLDWDSLKPLLVKGKFIGPRVAALEKIEETTLEAILRDWESIIVIGEVAQ
jgi:hypothetical protein